MPLDVEIKLDALQNIKIQLSENKRFIYRLYTNKFYIEIHTYIQCYTDIIQTYTNNIRMSHVFFCTETC
jgi:hypothetical protein